MRPQRIILPYFLCHAIVANLFCYDLLGENNTGTKSDKLGQELHILINFMLCMAYNCNELIFSVFVMTPAFLIAIAFQVNSFCKGEEFIKIEGEEQKCSQFQ